MINSSSLVKLPNSFQQVTHRKLTTIVSHFRVRKYVTETRHFTKSPISITLEKNKHSFYMNTLNIATRVQQGGTCWFHAIVNGVLMSWRMRKIIRDKLANIPTKESSKFWEYINHRLKGPGTVNKIYSNQNVIRSIGARRRIFNPFGMIPRVGEPRSKFVRRFLKSRSGVTGGTFSDLLNIYEQMFQDDFAYKEHSKKAPSLIIKKGTDFKDIITQDGVEYGISHSYIIISGYKGLIGHAICGYVTKMRNFRIFDSAIDESFSFDWRYKDNDAGLIKWMNDRLPITLTNVKKWAVYVRFDRM